MKNNSSQQLCTVSLGCGIKTLELLIMFIISNEVWKIKQILHLLYNPKAYSLGAYVLLPHFASFKKEIAKSTTKNRYYLCFYWNVL